MPPRRVPVLSVALCSIALLASACDRGEPSTDSPPKASVEPVAKAKPKPEPEVAPEPEPEPEPKPEPGPAIEVVIASVQFIEDCPDQAGSPGGALGDAALTELAPAAPAAESEPVGAAGRRAPSAGDSDRTMPDSCTQSTLQLAFKNPTSLAAKVAITEVLLLQATTSTDLGEIPIRAPMQWTEAGQYSAWDQIVPAEGSVIVSYKIGVPPPGAMGAFVLRLTLTIDGKPITLDSPEVIREPQHVMVT